jgi:hypothetical protein
MRRDVWLCAAVTAYVAWGLVAVGLTVYGVLYL